jgi:UDP-N-acetylmuramate dehydrogenase
VKEDPLTPVRLDTERRVEGFLGRLGDGVRGKILLDHPLSRLTTFRVGGAASVVFIPESPLEVEAAYRAAKKAGLPLKVLGRGSNVLASDQGFPGVVMLVVKRGFKDIRIDKCIVEVDAGLSLDRMVRWCAERGLAGMEGMAGIPGTMGGAVHNNAGARGSEISGVLREAYLFDGEGWSWVPAEGLGLAYRRSDVKGIIGKVRLELREMGSEELMRAYAENLAWRRSSQPLSRHSAGSVFKNGEGYRAGELIDRCGCKGWRIGDALVSEKHANFIVNAGRARSWQVLQLIEAVRARVREETGIELELEIELLGDFKAWGGEPAKRPGLPAGVSDGPHPRPAKSGERGPGGPGSGRRGKEG